MYLYFDIDNFDLDVQFTGNEFLIKLKLIVFYYGNDIFSYFSATNSS